MLGQGGRPQRRTTDAGARGSGAGCARRVRNAGLIACATVALTAAAPAVCSAAVTISPLAGTPDATPATQISILGTPASNIEAVTATGSVSGSHLGTVESYASSPGASFVPELPFTEGEEVHVVVHLKEGSPLEDSFTIAHMGPSEELLHQTSEKPELQEHYVTQPELHPPKVTVTTPDPSLEGDIFTDPLRHPRSTLGKNCSNSNPWAPMG